MMTRLVVYFLSVLVISAGALAVPAPTEKAAGAHAELPAKSASPATKSQSANTEFLKRAAKFRPTKQELAWQQIPWVAVLKNDRLDEMESLKEAFKQARHEKRPVLIWSPDGTPFDQC